MEKQKHLWINNYPTEQTIYIYKDLDGNLIKGHIVSDSFSENPYSEKSIYRNYVKYVGVAHKFIKNIKCEPNLKKI